LAYNLSKKEYTGSLTKPFYISFIHHW